MGEGTGSTIRLEEASIPKKSLNRFVNTSARKSVMELLGLENLIGVEGRELPDITMAEKRGLLGVPKQNNKDCQAFQNRKHYPL